MILGPYPYRGYFGVWQALECGAISWRTLRFNSKVVVLGVFVGYTKTNNAMKVLAYFAINHDALHILM